MALLFSDDFHRANGNIGNGWSPSPGGYDIFGNLCRCVSASNYQETQTASLGTSDHSIEVTVNSATTYNSARDVSILARLTGTTTSYYRATLRLGDALNSYVTLSYKTVATGPNEMARRYIVQPTAGDHLLALAVTGTHITVSYDGVAMIELVDNNVSSGNYFGLVVNGNSTIFLSLVQVYDGPRQAMSAAPPVILCGIAGQLIGLTGYGTAWVSGIPGYPVFSMTPGAITAQDIYTANSAGITVTGPDYPGLCIISDPDALRFTIVRAVYTLVQPIDQPYDPLGIYAFLNTLNLALTTWLQNLNDELIGDLNLAAGESLLGWARFIGIPPEDHSVSTMLATILRELQVDGDDPTTLRSVIVDTLAAIYYISSTSTNSLETVLTAIDAISAGSNAEVLAAIADLATQLTTAQTSLNIISGNDTETIALARNDVSLVAVDVGVLLNDTAAIRGDLDDIRTGSDYTLGTVGNWILGLGGVQAVTLVAVLASLVGRGTTTAIQIVDVVEDVVAEGTDLAGIATTIFGWLADRAEPTLPTISVDLGGIVNDIAGVHDDVAADLTIITDAISGAETDLSSQLDGLDAKLDQILSALAVPAGGVPSWPGLGAVTLGTPVAIAQNMSIDGPLDGALYEVTSAPTTLGKTVVGGHTTWLRLGQAAFVSDNGDMDAFQSVNWDNGILVPRYVLTPASLVLHFVGGVSGTVTPWVRTIP